MSKFILFLLLGVAVYWWLRGRRHDSSPHRKQRPADGPEVMVSCAYCGLHVPQSESVTVDGRHYCGEEHRQLDSDGGPN